MFLQEFLFSLIVLFGEYDTAILYIEEWILYAIVGGKGKVGTTHINILILNWGRVIASGAKNEIRSDLSQWAEELSVRCDDPQKLAGILFNADHLLGFDINMEEQRLDFRIKNPPEFYQHWNQILQDSGLTIFEISSKSQSLNQIFNKVTA